MEFKERLKKLRIRKGVTQKEVAKILNISRSTYSYYETGKTEPSLDMIVKLSIYYKVSTDFLLYKK